MAPSIKYHHVCIYIAALLTCSHGLSDHTLLCGLKGDFLAASWELYHKFCIRTMGNRRFVIFSHRCIRGKMLRHRILILFGALTFYFCLTTE